MEKYLLKMSAAGNRFLIVDKFWFEKKPTLEWKNHCVKTDKSFDQFVNLSTSSLSQRKAFIEEEILSKKELALTDGLVVVKKSEKLAFSCDFYNKDGSKAQMCGNAACCMSAYAEWMSLPLGSFGFGEELISRLDQGGIAFKESPKPIQEYVYSFQNEEIQFTFIKPAQVPHAVVECFSKASFEDKATLKKQAQYLRFKNPIDKEEGMNVSFFQIQEKQRLQAISFERGVEDFTLACGTGALAVAFVYLSKPQAPLKNLFINMPGGELKLQLKPQMALFSPIKKGY